MPMMIKNKTVYAGNVFDTQPIGEIVQIDSTMTPSGYLPCDGSSVLRSDYPELFKRIGTKYGAVDELHFNLPTENDVDTVSTNEMTSYVNGALTNVMAKSFSGRLGEIRCAKDNCNFTNGQYIWDLSNSFVKDYNGFICVATGEGINVTISGLQTDVSGKKITLNAKVLSNGSNYTGSLEVNLMVLAFN